MHQLPSSLQSLIGHFARLPGFGPKSAQRAAMALLRWPVDETRAFGEEIAALRQHLRLCPRCGALCEHDLCDICRDPSRTSGQLCVVPDWDSLLAFEGGGFFHGRYVILGGLLSPLDRMPGEALDWDRLRRIIDSEDVQEIVLALGATVEADATATYLKARILSVAPSMRICRLAQGIPLGQEVKTTDVETLRRSLEFRQRI